MNERDDGGALPGLGQDQGPGSVPDTGPVTAPAPHLYHPPSMRRTALILIAVIYDTWRPRQLDPILVNSIRESTMLMMIIGMSLLYSYVMSYLHISQSAAEWIVSMHFSRWATACRMTCSMAVSARCGRATCC